MATLRRASGATGPRQAVVFIEGAVGSMVAWTGRYRATDRALGLANILGWRVQADRKWSARSSSLFSRATLSPDCLSQAVLL